jgi:hypothetical protein
MDPRIKTFLKVLAGGALTGVSMVLVDPSNYVAFGSIAATLIALGAWVASKLEGIFAA